ncbi:MAG: MaoC family dehydratase N-terminal domain-containing protein [Proteobacteria bacterium]|nr:MaoC family dehydratase N-terminal domain-containing protein [Pseudomonadota bacterium]MBI3499110.1 MaoC family dehydratase N-terminal domain-containing protein [Pseudomonadota bacterium]
MAIDYQRLLNYPIPEIVQDLTAKDTILYALGVGLGQDPMDQQQLRFVYEEGLQALPTMAVVLAYPGFWLKRPDTGVDWVKVVHGEQAITIHQPLPVEGRLTGRSRVTAILDKGPGKGALLCSERKVFAADGTHLATLASTSFCRGDGGFGGPNGPTPSPHPIPERAAEASLDVPTLPQAALIYRLSGDTNPLHASPKIAAAAGFPRPILHGLATVGHVGHALIRLACAYDPTRLNAMQMRFSAPVYPGETIRTEIWREGGVVSFRARVLERDAIVINNGRAEVA